MQIFTRDSASLHVLFAHCCILFFSIKEIGSKNGYEVYMVDHSRIQSLYGELHEDNETNDANETIKRKCI